MSSSVLEKTKLKLVCGSVGVGEAGSLEVPIQVPVTFLPTLKASSQNVSTPRSDSLSLA